MKTNSLAATLAIGLLLIACSDKPAAGDTTNTINKDTAKVTIKSLPEQKVVISNPDELLTLFAENNYTPEVWQAGIHDIPRIFITNIPERWQKNAQAISVLNKKRIFFRVLAPLALFSNEKILQDRQRLLVFKNNKESELVWLKKLAKKYKMPLAADAIVNQQWLIKLQQRVDIIPVSLVLAQAAEESGWGTSRFSVEGNALFGQWDFSGKGMIPKQQRKELGNYGLARFDTPLKSVEAYMLNLNTHAGYQRLRENRAQMRKNGKLISGYTLAEKLDKYSERGYAYVQSIQGMMTYNKLAKADEARLVGTKTILVLTGSEK